jgi:hypothetical protein
MQFADASHLVATAIENAVMRSFETRPMRGGITQAEVRRRFEICEGIWKVLRLEQRWSVMRVCDHLERYLIQDIDGIAWEPDRRAVWIPDGSLERGHQHS